MNLKFLVFFLPFFLEAYHTSSSFMETDGRLITMKGNLIVKHEGLSLSAEEGMLEKASDSNQINRVALNENVKIFTASGFSLECDHSFIDFQNLKGKLISRQNPISLKGNLTHRDLSFSVECSCLKAELDLMSIKKNDYDISKIQFIDNVKTEINSSTSIISDIVHVHLDNLQSKKTLKELQFLKSENDIEFTSPQGTLKTDYLRINPSEKELEIGKSKGIFNKNGPVNYSFEKFFYLEDQKKLKIDGAISFIKDQIFSLSTNASISIERLNLTDLTSFRSISINGPFEVSYLGHTLKSYKPCLVDHSKKLVSIISENQKPSIFYKYLGYGIVADNAEIRYSDDMNQIEQIAFFGHVIILLDEPIGSIKTAMASRIIFYPALNILKLESSVNEKILFWTDDHQLALTVESLEFFNDPETKKTKCKTYGVLKSIIRSLPEINF